MHVPSLNNDKELSLVINFSVCVELNCCVESAVVFYDIRVMRKFIWYKKKTYFVKLRKNISKTQDAIVRDVQSSYTNLSAIAVGHRKLIRHEISKIGRYVSAARLAQVPLRINQKRTRSSISISTHIKKKPSIGSYEASA